jgi:hypothetical protein
MASKYIVPFNFRGHLFPRSKWINRSSFVPIYENKEWKYVVQETGEPIIFEEVQNIFLKELLSNRVSEITKEYGCRYGRTWVLKYLMYEFGHKFETRDIIFHKLELGESNIILGSNTKSKDFIKHPILFYDSRQKVYIVDTMCTFKDCLNNNNKNNIENSVFVPEIQNKINEYLGYEPCFCTFSENFKK